MNVSKRITDTFPNGLGDLIGSQFGRRHNAGGYELDSGRLPLFNDAMHRMDPGASPLGTDQFVTAARRVLERYPTGVTPAFVESRMRAWDHLQQLAGDVYWGADGDVLARTEALREYVENPDDVFPDHLPSIGLLDDALLIDVALQNLRSEIADYESFCHFRQVAAEFAGISEQETGLGREQWLQALRQAQQSHRGWGTAAQGRFAPVDARATLFHVM
ncbi:DUF1232 domain-containing protein [Aerolutibacter ruishenii]|uniref:DUF1232 domain-containing protein n=1 Tax=Aerolutibacter ruishenii TaxID=686800 RepID=A0A562LNG1_9GAMM|nr:DUF1232 domain-containing protein [Lysobacter ruishenii]TWI09169.1 hypothetical protein IP93_02332 [Lysobacter ruishenii]